MPTVQLLPPDAPQWIVDKWKVLYQALQSPNISPATTSQVTQALNDLATKARLLQQAAQQPVTQQAPQFFQQIGNQLRMMLQSVQPYLRSALQMAGAPALAMARYLALAQGFMISLDAAAIAVGCIFAAKVILAILAVIALLYLLALLYQWLNNTANAIQRHNQQYWKQTSHEAKREAARRIAEREVEKLQASFRQIAGGNNGILAALDNAYAARAM